MANTTSSAKPQPPVIEVVALAIERGRLTAFGGRALAGKLIEELTAAGYIIVRRETVAPTGGEKP